MGVELFVDAAGVLPHPTSAVESINTVVNPIVFVILFFIIFLHKIKSSIARYHVISLPY